jgi:hypothetical protein
MRHSKTNCRYCVRLGTVLRHFEKMSQGANQWITLPSSGIFISLEGEIRRYVLVGYSNPDSSGLPNAVIYGVRLIADKPHVDAVPTHQCCFAPNRSCRYSEGSIGLMACWRMTRWKTGDASRSPCNSS